MKISIHIGKSVQVLELAKRMHRRAFRDSDDIDHNDYMELVEQFLAYIESKASVGDDAQPGHPFYGNQYTEGNYTAKPKEAKSKIPKHAVHELLSSGHPFHIDELAEITGHQNKTSLASWISMFKKDNPKGKLDIVKVGPQTYQVVKKDGTPAPAAPMPEEEKQKPQQPAQVDPGSTKGAEPSSAPTEAPAIDPDDPGLNFGNPSNYAAKAAAYLHPPITVPAKPMTKAEADKVYADQHQQQIQAIQKMGQFLKHNKVDPKNLGPQAFDNVAGAYKAAKSAAMAQWATNTKGVAFEPKPSTVFPEDLTLMQNLAISTTQEEVDAALAQWKKDTHNAKLGKGNEALQKAQAEKEAAQAAAKAAAAKEEAEYAAQKKAEEEKLKAAVNVDPDADSPLKAPDAIVPEGHQHISSSDFDPDPTSAAGSSKFKREMMRVHNIMVAESTGSSQGNKQLVQKKLEARLKDAPHFQALQAQYVKSGDAYGVHKGSLASRLIGQWATSSGDHHAISVASQLAIREAFKMDPSKVETKAFHYLQKNSEDTTWRDAAKQLGFDVSTPEKMKVFQKGMQDFALAQYHETQEFFKSKGIKELHLVRGMRMGGAGESTAGAKKVKMKLQPASSFTVNHGTAAGFAGTGSMFAVKVPVEQVMGSYLTGYGCTGEHEVVVLAHESLEGVQMGVAHAKSTTSMDQTIQLARKYNGGVIPGEDASATASSTATASSSGSASAGAAKSYISSPTPPQMKIKVPAKPAGAGHYAVQLQKALKAGDLESFNAWVEKVQMIAPNPNGLPKTKQFIKEAQQAIQEAQAEHKVKMEKWTAYHKKHKTGAV